VDDEVSGEKENPENYCPVHPSSRLWECETCERLANSDYWMPV